MEVRRTVPVKLDVADSDADPYADAAVVQFPSP
jgi:hypothetical protein